jgi:hypothetical protein
MEQSSKFDNMSRRNMFIFRPTSNIIFIFMAREPLVGQGLLSIQISKPHSNILHIRQDFFGRVIDPLSVNTQHSKGKDIRVPGRVRTRNPSKRAALDSTATGIGCCSTYLQ